MTKDNPRPMRTRPRQPDRRPIRPRRSNRGVALIAVLWVILVGGVLLIGVKKMTSATLAMARNDLESVRAHWLARAGVERAMAELADDDRTCDGAWDLWYSDEDTFAAGELIGGAFSVTAPPGPMDDPAVPRYGVIDLAGRLDLNTAEPEQLEQVGQLEGWQVAAIVDWRDSDNNAQPGGAETLYYAELPYAYEIRNGPFQTVDELRLVRGMDGPVLMGEDANADGVLNPNENDFARNWPDDDGDGLLQTGLTACVSIYGYELNRDALGDERVNVNTVDADTLVERFSFTKALAEGFTSRQSGSSGNSGGGSGGGNESRGESSEGGSGGQRFNSLMDLLEVKPASQSGENQSSDDEDAGSVEEIDLSWLADHLDELTLSDDRRLPARVNVNTASAAVLRALAKMDDATVETIIRRQDSGVGPFESVGELLTSQTLSEEQFKAVAEKVTVRSNVFEIRSEGVTRWGIRQRIVAVVDRGTTPMSILYWYQSE